MNKASNSGLFEVWGGVVIEGDCVTPTQVRYMLLGVYPTSEAMEVAAQSSKFEYFEYLEVRAPKAYINRHAKLEAIKRARRIAADTTPF